MALIGVMSRYISQLALFLASLWLAACVSPESDAKNEQKKSGFENLQLFSSRSWGNVANGTSALTSLFHTKPQHPFTDADLLGRNNKTLREWEGRCELSPAKTMAADQDKSLVVEFQAILSQPSRAKGRLFAILLPEEKNILGYGVFDSEGKAHCAFPVGSYIASTGFGDSRVETHFEIPSHTAQPKPISLRMRETGRVILVPGKEQGISPGDMIRIGRTPLTDSTLLFPDASLARSIDSDLFKPVQSTQENGGVSEYLTTTFFMGENPLTIDLEEGFYHFALYSSTTGKQCLMKTSLQKEAAQYLRCEASEFSLLNDIATNTKIDATFLDAITREKWEKSGLLAKHNTRFIGLPTSEQNTFSLGHVLFSRTFDAEGILDAETACNSTLNSFSENKRPLAGTGEEKFASGATPFWITTASQFRLQSDESLTEGFYFLSNGSSITFSGITDGLLWPPLSQQRLRAVFKIPIGNSTNQMAIFINGKEHRRLAFAKESTWTYSRIVIDEPITKREDFTLAICAWGRTPLPEFVIGTRDILPLLVTRPVCVDADGDGRCNIPQ